MTEPERTWLLYGMPCDRCQLPAHHAELYPRGIRVVHQNRHLPPCDTVTTHRPERTR